MSWNRVAAYLSGALLACAVVMASAPIAIVIISKLHGIQAWMKNGTWPADHFADWYRMKLPHTSWIGLQRIFDSINDAPGPIVLLVTCIGAAILFFLLSRLVAGLADRPE